jgi:hypothetical protein
MNTYKECPKFRFIGKAAPDHDVGRRAAKLASLARTICVHLGSSVVFFCLAAAAADITTLDGQKYQEVRNVALKPNGLYFTIGLGMEAKGIIVAYTNLPNEIKEQYHCDLFAVGLAFARQNQTVSLNKNVAFSMTNLEAAKKKAKAENKLMGFIMVWDNFMVPARPMDKGSPGGLAHFYDVFHDALVLVFVRHESELGNVPDAVKTGFNGPEEGGFAPNMAVVTADCSQFVCEIPYGGKDSNGAVRDPIFRQKIAVIKDFLKKQAAARPASTGTP